MRANCEDALLTDKVKIKEQLAEAEQSSGKIQKEEVRKSVSATDTQSEDKEESHIKTKAKKVKVKGFLSSSSSESDSEEEERIIKKYPIPSVLTLFNDASYSGYAVVMKEVTIIRQLMLRDHVTPRVLCAPVDVPADTKDHEDDPDSTNIGTGAMDVAHLCSSICRHVLRGLPGNPTSSLHGGLASSLPLAWLWATSSSSPCPAFLAIAKSEPFIDIDCRSYSTVKIPPMASVEKKE
ncbi:hypothetical protein STEG23_024399 [Scotinomys teguina]